MSELDNSTKRYPRSYDEAFRTPEWFTPITRYKRPFPFWATTILGLTVAAFVMAFVKACCNVYF